MAKVEASRVFVSEKDSSAELAARAIAVLREAEPSAVCWVASSRSAGKLHAAAKMVRRHVPDASLVASSEGDDQSVFTFVRPALRGRDDTGVPAWWAG